MKYRRDAMMNKLLAKDITSNAAIANAKLKGKWLQDEQGLYGTIQI